MSSNSWFQLIFYLVVLLSLAKPLGVYMARVYDRQPTGLDKLFDPLEKGIERLTGLPKIPMDWVAYASAVLVFNTMGILAVYFLLRIQHLLPFNPLHLAPPATDSAFNTAISFGTNTNWQDYGGETTLSYLTQMAALTVQNFLSAATGMAVMAALVRGIRAKESTDLGNFWVDVMRGTLRILVPLSVIVALVLVGQGVVQTMRPSVVTTLLQPLKTSEGITTRQVLAVGPVASQVAIKQLGTNGGGFFNVNSAHPFENPTPFSNFIEMLSILLIPAALCWTFGVMVGDKRQGRMLLISMTLLFILFLVPCVLSEQAGNPRFRTYGVSSRAQERPLGAVQSGGNMEGKEVRFGIVNSALWAVATTAASNGSVNSMHDSMTPLGGLAPLLLIMLGEVVFGGAGSGLYGMLAFVFVAVFAAGLMVGRTPEYLGKKIGTFEMKMASLMVLIPPLVVLVGTAIGVASSAGRAGIANPGPHGFSEVLYAFASMANNNGSAFAGLSVNTPFYNYLGGLAMWVGRFFLMVPVLAIAGSLARKKIVPPGSGTLPTHTPLFIALLCVTVLIVGALTFIPALALGPLVEQLLMIVQ